MKVHISKMSNNQDIASKLSFMKFWKENITYVWWYLKHIFSMCYVYNRKFNQKSICLRFYDYFLGSQLRLCSWKYSIFEQKPMEIYINKSCLQINQLIYRLYVIYKKIYKYVSNSDVTLTPPNNRGRWILNHLQATSFSQ